jgi:hypothetical protein
MNIDFENEVLDLTALREEQQLNENILNVFAAWIQYLLSKMYDLQTLSLMKKDTWIISRNMDLMIL